MRLADFRLRLISLIFLAIPCSSLPQQIRIGILLNENQYEQEILFKWSIEQINHEGILNRTKIYGITKKVVEGDSWDAETKACELFEEGAIAIVGPTNIQTSQHVGSICDALDVPHLNIVSKGITYSSQPTSTNIIIDSAYPKILTDYQSSVSVDLSISRGILIRAYLDLLKVLKWEKFVYLYDDGDFFYNLQEHFDGRTLRSKEIKVLRFDPSKPYRDAFWTLKRETSIKHIMLDVQCSNLHMALKHAQQVSMMTEAHSYVVVCLDAQTFDLDDFRYSKSRIIWLNWRDPYSHDIMSLTEGAETRRTVLPGVQLNPELLHTDSVLIHDALETMAHAFQGVDSSQYIDLRAPISCSRSQAWPYGSTIVNYLRTVVELNGMTGKIRFNSLGQRSDFVLNIVYLSEDGPKTVGNWSHGAEPITKVEASELSYLMKGDQNVQDYDQRETLIVSSLRSEPYFMNKQTTKIENGNARYEGYVIDLIEELSKIVGFDYILREVEDGKHGKYDERKKEWNGLIREVMSGKADLAVGDLSITSSREDAVDFTLPYMSTGISILFKKPTTKELELFSFLSPFEHSVWVYVCGAYVGVSVLLFLVSRISPYEWADPHPCRKEDKILRNQFSLSNSFWFTIAALMQQGSDLAPRSLSTRLVSAIWYFFTLIMISSYTANLAAFLTVEKVVYPIERAEDLYKHPMHLRYGCVESGSTGTFFQNSKPQSTFRKMYSEMVFMPGNEQGKSEVEKGNYAFFMESTSIEYIIERNCNLTQIGGLLDSKGYGIAIAKNSTRKKDYRTKLSEAILSLQESGMLEILKNRWWKEKRGGGACDIDENQNGEGVKELTLANVGGVFVVLGIGITIAFGLCAAEVLNKSYRLAAARGTNKWVQIKKMIEFSLALSENY